MCNFFTKRRFSALFWLTRTSSGANFHIGGRVCMKFSHTKSCQRSLVWPTRKTVMCIHCEKRSSVQLFDLHGRVRMQISSWEDVSVYNLSHSFLCLGLDRHVSTQCVDYKTCSCACSHTKRRVSAHFLSNEVISMRNVKQCWSPNFP